MILLGSLLVLIHLCEGSKLLLLPLDHHAHIDMFINAGKALLNKGHEVHLLATDRHRERIEISGIKPILHTRINTVSIVDDTELSEMVMDHILGKTNKLIGMKRLLNQIQLRVRELFEEIMENKELQERLKLERFDMAIMDGIEPGRMFYIIPYKYNIPVITISAFITDPWDSNVPAILSVEPFIGSLFSNQMNFFQRLVNVIQEIVFHNVRFMLGLERNELVRKYAPEKPYISLSDLYKKSEMFINELDIYTIDYPRISAPHYIYVGGLLKMSAKPLSPELENFVASAAKGTIIITFGQVVKQIPDVFLEKIVSVCDKMPETHFVVRNGVEVTRQLPSNVKVMKWIPQNDLLGHPNVKVFMSHAGTNGMRMAINFGKPMILAPVTGLEYNVLQATSKQYGKRIDLLHDKPEDIVEVLLEVLENPLYTQKVEEAMRISHALPQATDTLAFWVDHILKYGSKHIRPAYMDMPLYKLLMLDILGLLVVLILLLVLITYKCCKCMCNRTRSPHSKPKKD